MKNFSVRAVVTNDLGTIKGLIGDEWLTKEQATELKELMVDGIETATKLVLNSARYSKEGDLGSKPIEFKRIDTTNKAIILKKKLEKSIILFSVVELEPEYAFGISSITK